MRNKENSFPIHTLICRPDTRLHSGVRGRHPDKSVLMKNIFVISQLEHMLWVFKLMYKEKITFYSQNCYLTGPI